MTVEELRQALRAGEVNFKFAKKDGSIREAKGTTNPELISEFINESESESKRNVEKPDDMVVYFDLDKKSFRSFRESQFITE